MKIRTKLAEKTVDEALPTHMKVRDTKTGQMTSKKSYVPTFRRAARAGTGGAAKGAVKGAAKGAVKGAWKGAKFGAALGAGVGALKGAASASGGAKQRALGALKGAANYGLGTAAQSAKFGAGIGAVGGGVKGVGQGMKASWQKSGKRYAKPLPPGGGQRTDADRSKAAKKGWITRKKGGGGSK